MSILLGATADCMRTAGAAVRVFAAELVGAVQGNTMAGRAGAGDAVPVFSEADDFSGTAAALAVAALAELGSAFGLGGALLVDAAGG